MLSKSHKAILVMMVLSLSFQSKAQVIESISPNVISAAQDDLMIEMQTIDGEVFLVKKKNLVKPEAKAEGQTLESETVTQNVATEAVAQADAAKKEITSSDNQLSNSIQKNIQINVDAKKYFNNSVNNITNNLDNVTVENTNTEIKNNTDSLIQKDVSESTATKQDTKADISNQEVQVKKDSDNVITETNTTDTTVTTQTNVDNSTEVVVTPPVVEPVPPVVADPTDPVTPPVVVDPVDPVTPPVVVDPVDPTTPPVVDPVTTELLKKESKYFVRAGFGMGTFTTISDVESNFSFGLGLGYNINKKLGIELQYTLTEFEDTYSYSHFSHDQVFKQNDFAAVLNYVILDRGALDIRVRGGLNYAHRTYSDAYYGYTNSSNSMSAILGIGGDIKVDKNIFITANADYYYNFSDNGYNIELDTLDLVAGQNYFIFNIGVKYKF